MKRLAAILLLAILSGCSSISGEVDGFKFSSNRLATDVALQVTNPDGTSITYSNNVNATLMSGMLAQMQALTTLATKLVVGPPLAAPEP